MSSSEEHDKMLKPHTTIIVNNAMLQFEQENPVRDDPPGRNYKIYICGVVAVLLISSFVGYSLIQSFSAGKPTSTSADHPHINASESALSSTTHSLSSTTLSLSSTPLSVYTSPIPARNTTESPSESLDYPDPDEIPFESSRLLTHDESHQKLPRDCGRILSTDRIQHGKKAQRFEHPWIVVITHISRASGVSSINCGGSLISDRLILTASHCIADAEEFDTKIQLGEYNLQTEPDCVKDKCANHTQDFTSEEFSVVKHPDDRSDIAVIKLKRPAVFSESVQPLCLPLFDDEMPKTAEIIGFGMTEKGRLNSRTLLKASVKVYDYVQCRELSKNFHNTTITENHLCAQDTKNVTTRKGVEEVTIDTCSGDSGAPLLSIKKSDGLTRYTQYGITSFGQAGDCGASKAAPGVYVKVSSYLDWILEQAD